MRAISTKYNGKFFRSRLEARWAVFFDALAIRYSYEPEGYDIDGINYLPDFWLHDQRCFFEVKPKELAKPMADIEKAQLLARASGTYVFVGVGDPWTPCTDSKALDLRDLAHFILRIDGKDKGQYEQVDVDYCTWYHCKRCNNAIITKLEPAIYYTQELIQGYRRAAEARFEFGESPLTTPIIAYTGVPQCQPNCDVVSLVGGVHTPTVASINAHPKGDRTMQKPSCPICGHNMYEQSGKLGPFLSCEKYPTCKGIVNLPGNSLYTGGAKANVRYPAARLLPEEKVNAMQAPRYKAIGITISLTLLCVWLLTSIFADKRVPPINRPNPALIVDDSKKPEKAPARPKRMTTLEELVEYAKSIKEQDYPLCPDCNKRMKLRFNGNDGKPFFGCTDFPRCKRTKNVETPN